jgi:hypothetical protein
MTKRYREIRVHLSDDGRLELGEVARPWLKVGDLGAYVVCKKVDPDGTYFRMTVEVDAGDDDPVEVEINVPHWAVKAFFSVRDAAGFDALYEGIGGSPRRDDVADAEEESEEDAEADEAARS